MRHHDLKRAGLAACGLAVVLAASLACSSSGGSAPAGDGSSAPAANSGSAGTDSALKAELPAKIRDAGVLNAAGILIPPYASYKEGTTTANGLSVDLAADLSTALGIPVKFSVAPSITEVYSGMASGRYDIGLTPTSDTVKLEATYDFVDWLREYVVFAVKKGNPKNISDLSSVCGASVATLQGGSAATVLATQKATCASEGKAALTVNTYPDQGSAILSVQSGRNDAAFSSQIPLTYYVQQSQGSLQLAGANGTNGFPNLRVGTQTSKDNGLAPVILKAFAAMKQSGAYDALLKKYGISGNVIPAFGMNLNTTP